MLEIFAQLALLEYRNVICCKFSCYTSYSANINIKEADETIQMCRLVYTFVVHMQQNQVFPQ